MLVFDLAHYVVGAIVMAQIPRTNDPMNRAEERRNSALYFVDGDIVVTAASKNKSYTEFYRVDRVFLARHSTIFKDMFVVGKSDLQMERYDGIPKVHLPDDAEDVAGFLSAMYDITCDPFYLCAASLNGLTCDVSQ